MFFLSKDFFNFVIFPLFKGKYFPFGSIVPKICTFNTQLSWQNLYCMDNQIKSEAVTAILICIDIFAVDIYDTNSINAVSYIP